MKHALLSFAVASPILLSACGPAPLETPGDGIPSPAIHAEFACSGVDIAVSFQDEAATMDANGKTYELTQVVTASGAKYQAEGEPETSFWNKGDGGTLVLEGVEYPDCARTD